MPCEILKTLYYAHIYPHLLYCNPIWITTYTTHLTCLDRLHKKIIRIITKSSYLEHTTLFKITKILKLQDITKLSIANCMYKNYISASLPSHQYPTQHRTALPSIPSPYTLQTLHHVLRTFNLEFSSSGY